MSNITDHALETDNTRSSPRIGPAKVIGNAALCREHHRLTLHVARFPDALPGQFVQLSPESCVDAPLSDAVTRATGAPLLPRAFSIGGLRRSEEGCEIDVVYRVVGSGTRWMAGLAAGDRITLLGPLGGAFPVSSAKSRALLVIGGVGLPPLLWLAERLQREGKQTIACLGAQTRDLIPLDLQGRPAPATDAGEAVPCSAEFAAAAAPMIVSTDDGSFGFRGNVVQALAAHVEAQSIPLDDCVVYTCGPERMMQATAEYCNERGVECYVCMERPMACGVGTCQSCIVTVKSEEYASGQRYVLCCADGPVFAAERIIWNNAGH